MNGVDKMMKKMGKKGQVAVWIIIAILVVGALLVIFYPRLREGLGRIFVPSPPDVRIEECVDDFLEGAVDLIARQGGSISPENSILYQDNEIEYLCYTNQYYQTCSIQQPLLRQHVEQEILDYIQPDAENCIESLKQDLIERGYSVSQIGDEISVEIEPEEIKVMLPGLSFVKDDVSESYEEFEVIKKSEMYDLIMIATSILNSEARLGDADITTYMIYYPDIRVEKIKQSDGSKIYILTNTLTEDKFVFATRSLSWPAGYGFDEVYTPN